MGKRITTVTVLSGSVVRVWGVLESLLERHALELGRSERTMRVVRVSLGDAGHLVGVRYPPHLLPEVVATLASIQSAIAAPAARGGMQSQKLLTTAGLVGTSAASIGMDSLVAAGTMHTAHGLGVGHVQQPTPVDKKSLAKALRPPKTIHDFFKPKQCATEQQLQQQPSQQQPSQQPQQAKQQQQQKQQQKQQTPQTALFNPQQQDGRQGAQCSVQQVKQQGTSAQQQQHPSSSVISLDADSDQDDVSKIMTAGNMADHEASPTTTPGQHQQLEASISAAQVPAAVAVTPCPAVTCTPEGVGGGSVAGDNSSLPAAKRHKTADMASPSGQPHSSVEPQYDKLDLHHRPPVSDIPVPASRSVMDPINHGAMVASGTAGAVEGLHAAVVKGGCSPRAGASDHGLPGLMESEERPGSSTEPQSNVLHKPLAALDAAAGMNGTTAVDAAHTSILLPVENGDLRLGQQQQPSTALVNATKVPNTSMLFGSKQAQALTKLQGMGFTVKQAQRALWASNGDVNRAVDWILSGM